MQNLWVETHEGRLSLPAVHLRAAMRARVGRVLYQLHDRNTAGHFLPPEAFHFASLSPAMFRREAAAAAASPGGLFEATHTRVGVVLRSVPAGLSATPARARKMPGRAAPGPPAPAWPAVSSGHCCR